MEDAIMKVFVVMVSLLLSKDHTGFRDQDEDIVSLDDHELVLLKEKAMLEEVEHGVAMELPHSNQEVSQSYQKVSSDVQLTEPRAMHEEQLSLVGEENVQQMTHAADEQTLLRKEKLSLLLPNKELTNEQVNSGSTLDKNTSKGRTDHPERLTNVNMEPSSELKANQALVFDQKLPNSDQMSSDQEETLTAYIWRTFSLISIFRFLNMVLKKRSILQRNAPNCKVTCSNVDHKTLVNFYNQCVLVQPSHVWQTCDFVEGFLNDILERMRSLSPPGSINIDTEDFVGIGSLYEQWASRNSVVCDIHLTIVPPKLYAFEFELLKECKGATVKVVKRVGSSDECHCRNSKLDNDDLLCLLHSNNKVGDYLPENWMNAHLCQGNSSFLSKKLVMKWFKTAIRCAWKEISHKYEFELILKKCKNPGCFKVRFRSGRVVLFNLTPVVRFKGSDVHLMSYLPSDNLSDTQWPLCFARYEKALFQHITKSLPENACHIQCLQILSYLHKQQTDLTGACGLRSYHFKNALLFLLVNKALSWDTELMGCRINDVLNFLQQKLKAKTMNYVLVGNSRTSTEIGVPEEFRNGKPLNLFLSLYHTEELYLRTHKHLIEMSRNLMVLIQECGLHGSLVEPDSL